MNAGAIAVAQRAAAQREAEAAAIDATLREWREKYIIEEDGREFVSVPVAVFDRLLITEKRYGR